MSKAKSILSGLTDEEIISAGMSLLGMRTSKRKAKSSARNGKLAWSKKRKPTGSKRDAKRNGQSKLKKNKSVASV